MPILNCNIVMAKSLNSKQLCFSLKLGSLCQKSTNLRGMQRFLDVRGEQGSWMPRAGQIPLFCPTENLHFPRNVSIFSNFFWICLPKFLMTFFKEKIGSLDAPGW